MTFEWRDYLDLARELAANPNPYQTGEEARLRAAVSRAYYAAFIKARTFLTVRLGLSLPPQINGHWGIIQIFLSHADQRLQQVGADMARLRNDRNVADYENIFPRMRFIAARSILLAEQIINTLASL